MPRSVADQAARSAEKSGRTGRPAGSGGNGSMIAPAFFSAEVHVESEIAMDATADVLHNVARLLHLAGSQLVARRNKIVREYRPQARRGAAAAEAVVATDREQQQKIADLQDELAAIRTRRARLRIACTAGVVALRRAA